MSDTPALASRSPDTDQPLAQRDHARMAAAEPQAVGLRHLRPAAARHDRPRTARIACSVCCTVAGDSVGSDAFGIWMVREPESKPWPKSLLWF